MEEFNIEELNDFEGDAYTIMYENHHKKLRYLNVFAKDKEGAIKKFLGGMRSLFKIWLVQECERLGEEYTEEIFEREFLRVIKVVDCNKV